MNRKIILSLLLTSASYLFAGSYDNGIDFYKQKKYEQAMDSFKIAVNNSDNRAMLAIGIMYANGDGVQWNPKISFEWILKAAEAENHYAFIKLGDIYASQQDFKNAFKWFKKAADLGDGKASYNLGYFYTGGLGVESDLKKALEWYKKSAMTGNVDAQLNLGFMYIGGQGTKSNYKEAAYWIKKAKDTGNDKADMMWQEFKLYQYEEK
jgi:uncharacterized protein